MSRKYEQEEPMDNYTIRLPAQLARWARKKGGGSLAKGVRRWIEEGKARDDADAALLGVEFAGQ